MKTHFISNPVSPSENISLTSERATKVTITYGGGMGGSKREIYAKSVIEVQKFGMTFVQLTPFFGEVEQINPKYIVSLQECNMVTQVTDSTKHANFHKKVCERRTITCFYEVGIKDVVQSIVSNKRNDLEPVHKIILTYNEQELLE